MGHYHCNVGDSAVEVKGWKNNRSVFIFVTLLSQCFLFSNETFLMVAEMIFFFVESVGFFLTLPRHAEIKAVRGRL